LWPALAASSLFACGTGSAIALNQNTAAACTVTGPAKYVEEAGGTDALCQAVVAALAKAAPGAHRVEVKLLSPSRMAAAVQLADGRTLPELRFAVSDGAIGAAVVRRFAQDIANQISSSVTHQR
jgi:hypothetical protein